jgi:hypothetical protein
MPTLCVTNRRGVNEYLKSCIFYIFFQWSTAIMNAEPLETRLSLLCGPWLGFRLVCYPDICWQNII